MPSFTHQLKVLLWKNCLNAYRQPIWSVVLIVWPVVIFIILAITRPRFPPEMMSNCYLAPRSLQSAGLIPFLQTVLCNSDTTCSNSSYSQFSFTPRSLNRKKRYSVDTGGGRSTFLGENVTGDSASMWNESVVLNTSYTTESLAKNITVWKTAIKLFTSGDVKGALCLLPNSSTITQQSMSSNTDLQLLKSSFDNFCKSNKTMVDFVAQALLPQAISAISNATTRIEKVQSNTALWDFLLMLPEWNSDYFNAELAMNISTGTAGLPDVHPCINFILTIERQVRNGTYSTVLSGLLKTLISLDPDNELKACISLYQWLPCEVGTSQCWPEVKEVFEISYWLMASMTNGTSNNACTFNGTNVICNNTVSLEYLFQSAMTLIRNVSEDTANLLRITQRVWVILKQNRIDELVLQNLQQKIAKEYPGDTMLQNTLTELVDLLLNTTESLVMELSMNPQYLNISLGTVQKLLGQFNVPGRVMEGELMNISQALNNVLQTIVQNIYYMDHLAGFVSSYNVSSLTMTELQFLIQTSLSIHSDWPTIYNDTTFLKIVSLINQPELRHILQVFQTLLNLDSSSTNVTTSLIESLSLLNQVLKMWNTSHSSLITEVYLEQITNFIHSNINLLSNLLNLNLNINGSQLAFLQSDSLQTFILDFLTPSNLQNIGPNITNLTSAVFRILSTLISPQDQEILHKIESATVSLLNSVSICETELNNCTRTLLELQQELIQFIMLSIHHNSSTQQTVDFDNALLQFQAHSSAQISVLNNIVSLLVCFQQSPSFSCNTPITIYNEILDVMVNLTLTNDQNPLTDPLVLQSLIQNLTNLQQVMGSVNLTRLLDHVQNVVNASECYSGGVQSLQCSLKMFFGLINLFNELPFPQPLNDTLTLLFSINEAWSGELEGVSDIYQHLTYMYNLTQLALQNGSVLHEIHASLMNIVQTLEVVQLSWNSTTQGSGKFIDNLLEMLQFSNINYTSPATSFTETYQKLEDIKKQLLVIQWYVLYLKNETENFSSSGNMYPFVAMTQLILNNILSSMKTNSLLPTTSNEILYVLNILETSPIVPSLQSLFNIIIKNDVQNLENIFNHTVSALQIIFQDEFLNGAYLTTSFNEPIRNDTAFLLSLLQWYDPGSLANQSSTLIFVEKILLVMQSFLNDTAVIQTSNSNTFQSIYNLSQEFMAILYNVKHVGNVNVENVDTVYQLFLQIWNTSQNVISLKFKNILYLSMQCISENILSSTSQNCSFKELLLSVQLMLNDSDCQVSLLVPDAKGDMDLNTILEGGLISFFNQNMTGCSSEATSMKEGLVCFIDLLRPILTYLSRTNIPFGLNITLVQQMDASITIISEKLVENNMTCTAIDEHITDNLKKVFDTLDIMVLLVSNQTQNGMQYSELWNETVNILKFYISTQGQDLSNDKTFTIINYILSHLLTITSDGTNPWLKVLTVLETLANLSATLDPSEQLSIFPQILNTVNKVASLADRARQAAVLLPNVYSSYIFNANSSVAFLNLFKQLMSAQNVTSAKSCDNFLQSFLASGQNANLTGLEGNDELFGNISMWTCSLIFQNDSIIDWTQELKSILAIIVNVEQANVTRFAEVALEIITSFKDFINGTSKDTFDSLIASLSEAFKELVSSKKWIVYQAIRDFVNSLTSLVNEALINGNNNHILTAEKVTVGAIEAVSVLLKSLNVTSYETVLSFTSEIVQVYFSSRNSSLSMDDIFQKILTPIVTFLQNNGFEKFIMQTLQSQVSGYNSENLQVLKIFQELMTVVFNTIKGAASENELQPPYLTTNIILNMINTIVGELNDTRLQETIFGNSKNITDTIAILANAILQNSLQESNVSFTWVLPQNETSQTIHNLEVLINNLISKSGFDPSFYLNSSASFVKILYHLYEQDHKEQLIQMVNYILNNSNPIIDSVLVNALGNLHDLIHLNYTNNQNMVQELYLKQLLNFLSDSKLHITLMELSPLLNLSHTVPFISNKDLRDFSIELLEFLHPLNLYNIGNDQKNLTSVLFNLLSNYTPQTQGNFRNITIALVTVMEILQQCNKDAEICISAIPLFQNSVADMADALNSFAMYNDETSLNISLVQFEMLDKSDISLINNVFLALWYAQENFSNFSGDILDVYQEFLSASQLIMNITRDLNVKTFESDLEIVRNDLNQMKFIMQVLAKSNMIESLLQIINIQQGPCCLNQTDVDCLLCTFNLTSHFLSLLQNLGLSAPLKERIEIMHSLVDYWMSEVSTAANVYQQIIIFYENTKVTFQNEPTLHNLLITLSNISLTLEEFKMDNMTSTSNIKQTLDILSELLQPELTLDLFNITFNTTSNYLEKVQAQLDILQWYLMYIKNHNVSGEIYPMYRLTQTILSNTILNWVDLNNSSVIGYIFDKIKLSPEEADTFFKQLSQLFSGNQSNLLDQKIWAEILHFVTTLKPMTGLSTSVSPEFTTIWQIVDKILVSDWNITYTNDVFKDVQMILTNQNVSIAQDFLQAYDVVINILNLTHSGGNMNFTQLLDFSVNSFSTMDCRVAGKLMTVIFQAIRKGFSPTIWPDDALILNVTIDICDLLHWNNSQDDWAKLLQFTRNIAATVESFMPDNSSKKYFDAAEIIIASAAKLVFEPTFSQATVVSIMNIAPAINELFGIVENITFQHLFYTFLDLATSTSSPKEILLLKLENFILEAVQPIQDALKAGNDSSYNIILSFSLEALKQFINMSKDTSLEDNIYIPFMKQMWALFRNSSLEDLIISKVNQLALENSPHLSKDPTIWGHFLQLLFSVTDLVISETSSTPPYVTIDKMTRILQTVLEDILTTFLPQSESITDLLEQSFQVVLNVTRVFLDISEQNKISQLKELINSITTMTLSMTDLSNDTAKLFHFFSVINQTGLIPQIDNTLNIIFNSGSTEQGKLFLNTLDFFNELIQMKDISNIHELSSIFSKYMLSSLQNGNQTQNYLNTVLNVLLYLNHLSGEGNANLDNGLIDVFPLFISTELQHLSSEVINQAARLLRLIADYIPVEEKENFQNIANISLQLVDSIHNCSVTLNNCTDLTKGIQNFLWDIIQLQAVIQNGSLEEQFTNSSFLQIGSYDSFQKTLINDIYTLFSYSLGHPHNSSVFVEDVYDEVLAAVHWILNTSRDNQNMSILSSLESVIEVLTSANISELIHQTENMVFAALCIDQEDKDPLLCSLDLTYQLTQLLKLLPWTQPMHNRLSTISTVAAQWLSTINVNVSTSQQLIHLYNTTLLMYQHQPILHAINTSAVNIIQMLQESGNLLNVTVNGADAAVNLLSVILQAGDFEATKYNISDVLTYNISDLLESIRLQLDVVQLVMLQVTNKTVVLENNPGAYVMHTITQWILENYQQINLVIRDAQSLIASFNSSVSLMDLIHIFGETLQGEQFHVLIQQIEAALQKLSNSNFHGKPLLNHTIVGDILMQLPQLTLNLTNMIISETLLSSPNTTSNIVNKILETVMDNIMRILLPQTENIKKMVEESLENVLNVTKIILYMSEQNEISQLYQLVNSLTTLTFGVDLSNDTAKLAHLFSVINQTGLIPQIANTLQIIFNSDNMEQGKLILNALDMFNNITQMKDINNIHELSSIFTTYLPSSLVNVTQTQRYLNVILNLLLYFNNIPEEHPASLTNGVLNVLPFFLTPDLQNLGNDIINQSSGLLGLLADYIPSEEQDNFQKVSNISLQLIESIHYCSVSLDNCTDLTQGIQNFLWDIIQLQAVIQNGSLEEHFTNSSFLQIGSYDSFQKTLINDIYTLFSYSLGHPHNSSVFVEDVCDEVLAAVHWILNTSRDNQNMSILSSLESVIEVLTSANISELIHQTENIVFAALCIDQEDKDPLLCSLDLTYQLTQLLKLLPWTQPMHNRLSTISTVAAQWLSTINVNVSASQQLIHLYNATLLMYQHQPILHAINTSAVNIIQMLQESGNLLNVTVNGADAAVNLLSVILQAGDFEATKYNISDVLTYNISDLLESIRLQLDAVQWAMLQVANKTALLESNPGAYVMHTITQWILKNYPYINPIMQDTQSVINSFNGSFSLTTLIHLINSTVHTEQIQLLINQAAVAMKNSSNGSFLVNLILNENIQDDTELALHILQEFNHINLSMTLSSIDKVLQVLQRLLAIDLGPLHLFNNNATLVKIYSIVKEGMSILNNIQEKGSINKEMVYRMYNFTYLLVQDEWNWTPFQNISAMEAELLDVWFLAMSPFLGGTESQEYIGNCSAQDVLNILVETIFHDATGNESIWEGNCLWRFVYNSSDPNLQNNYTLNEMIYLALQSSPVFHKISTEGSLHPLAGDMACLLQLMEISVSALASLNNASGLSIPVIRSLNDSLAFIYDEVMEHNTTFHEEVHLVHLLDQILLNQSNSIQFFMLFFVEIADLNIQTLDLQINLAEMSSIVKTLATLNGQDRVLELIEKVINITHQPYFLQSWNVLDSFLFMNWTASEINDSISVLEKLRKVITILVNSGMEAKPIQIYQAIVSLLKTQNTTLLNMGSPSEMNASSVIQCGVALSAAFRFSDSLWVALDPQHSSLNQQFLSNISSLVCNLVNVQSLNYTWNSDLEMIIHTLQYVANVIPSEVHNYFTAAEKILSLLFGLPSSMNSTEDMVMVVYELLIEELRIFNRTNTIASWLEAIPLRSIYLFLNDISSDFKATAPEHQITITESNISNVLLEALNATSYPQALSSLSKLMTLVPSSGLTNITQYLLSLNVHSVLLPEPYSTVMNCLKNATQVLATSPPGHLEGIIQLIQDVFTQSNGSANASMIPHLLKEKIYQLQNLTTLVCGLSGTNSTQSCFMVCQDNALLRSILDLVVTSIENLATVVETSSSLTMKTVIEKISAFPQELLSSIIPFDDLQNVTSTLSKFFNVSSTNKQATVQDVFYNSSRVRNQLSRVVKLSPGSIEALMMLPLDDVKKQVISWFTDSDNSTTNFSTIDKLPPAQGYQMAIIFLQNVDIYNLLYRLIAPSEWQGNIDLIVALLKNMTDMITPFPQERINKIIQVMNFIFNQNITTSRTTKASSASFMDISKALCNGNYLNLVAALNSPYPTLRMTRQVKAQSLKDTFGIPGDNKFCLELFSTLVNSTSGANYWIVLKPMLYGQILYTPKTVETEEIMRKTNRTLQEIWGVKDDVANMNIATRKMLNMWPLLQNVKKLKNIFDNQFVRTLLEKSLDLNITDLSVKLNQTVSLVDSVGPYVSYFGLFTKIADVLSNLLSCMDYNRIHPMNNSTEMEQKAKQLQETNNLFAAVTFDLPVGSTRQRRSVSGKQPLPKKIKYSITMRSLLSEDTTVIKDDYWIPGPHNLGNKYTRGFVYLQENIERAIIEVQTNKSLDDLVARYQPMPYPCYKKDQFLAGIFFTFPIALMIAWVLFIAFFVKKLVHDKEMRLHEYMKMMGVNSCSHFFAWFIESAIFLIITVAILVLILKFGQILPNSNGFILFLFFLDYSMTVIAMSYLISVFFHNTSVAALSGSLIYIITFFPFIVIASKEKQLSFAAKTLLSIFSPTALSYGSQFIVNYEQQNIGIQWHNLYNSPVTSNDNFSCGWICWVMLIDSLIYFIVGAYIRTVFPGKYGIGAPWYFPVLPSYWSECCGFSSACSKKTSGMMFTNLMAQGESHKKDAENNLSQNYEPEPTGLNVGVSLHGLTKVYQSKAAVQNLNLTFYEGHITALLGHNGAGKTTTLSMLTGLFSATSGTIFVYGEDIRTHLDKARRSMGVCMQYDVLFDYLTTKEHLLLYGSIKAPQWNKSQLHEEVERTLKDTGLYRHSHKPVKALSGGMRRKLSICIAMIGGSKVVILDEPTTGVDPCSRRSIWDVISRNKMDKTIILSTHHLDEAEVLSDRIAFLEQGGLKCCGSPMFLKDRFGSGYHLTLTKKYTNQETDGQCNSEEVTALIQSHIPEARLKEDVGGELIYVLPPFKTEISNAYLSLLRALDTSLNDLNIGYYGISDTTIEEVFLKLTDGVADDEQDNAPLPSTPEVIQITNRDNNLVNDESSSTSYSFQDRDDQALTGTEKIKGVKLTFKKIMALFIKRFHHSKRDWKGAISQIVLPVLFVIAAMGLGSLSKGDANYPELLLSPNLYGTTEQAVVFGSYNARTDNLISAMLSPPGIDNICLDNNVQCLKEDSLGYWNSTGDQQQPYGTCNCSTSFAVCGVPDATPPHRRTYSRQMLYNITGHNIEKYLLTTTLQFIQKRYGGWSFGDTVPKDSLTEIFDSTANKITTTVWYNPEGPHSLPAFLNSFNNFLLRANLPSNESDEYGIFVSNKPLPGSVPLATTAITLVNSLVALSILAGYSITTASFATYVVKEYHNGSKRLQHIAGVGEVIYWLTNFFYDLIIYFIPVALSIAMIAAFQLPAFYNYPNLGAVSLLFILFGYATFAWMYLVAGAFKNPNMAFIVYVCINLFIGINSIISTSVVYLLTQQTGTSNTNYQSLNQTYYTLMNVFKIFPQFCFGYGLIQLSQEQAIQNQLSLYGNIEKNDIFKMDILGWMLAAMAIEGTFCLVLRLLINEGIIFSIKSFFKKTCLKGYDIVARNLDEDEDVKTERERVESHRAEGDLLQLQGLTKAFYQVNKKTIAVNNMSLGIPPGECFGLLGVNGAGKTTTFKMLTGDIIPSRGNIQVRDQTGNLVNVLGFNTDWSAFGYCPQEDALDELMTGEEHLYYYARIHGIPDKKIKSACHKLLCKLHLLQYKDRITANYSCGTRRKLSTALALIGRPSILLLDEPSSGMDPKTKRHLWKIISEEVKDKCAVVLTSHSMEECEALCTRLAIMVRGKFQCIGSLQHIKSRFGSGFTVKMHLKDSSVDVETITSFMHFHFPNTYLKDKHFTMVEYHVPVSAGGVAGIFEVMEPNKANLNIIHFSVSQTTLDEVFINFAQSQASPDNSSADSQEFDQVVVT